MTAGQQLVNTSKYESGPAWMLLQFPEECEDGGIIINSELVKVEVLGDVKVEVEDDVVLVAKEQIVQVEVEDDIIRIKEIKREVIDVVC